jgi:erythronate-4-phosphate dehydrogenase
VTLHVPLDATTRHFLDPRRRLEWLVNASRGEVVDGQLLDGKFALDVFENEPSPSPQLVDAAAIATPHIAGHSVNGKLNGTKMVYDAACRFLGRTPSWSPRYPKRDDLTLQVERHSDEELLLQALGYGIEADDRALRQIAAQGESFRKYRDQYPERLELTGTRVTLSTSRRRLSAALSVLGAEVH